MNQETNTKIIQGENDSAGRSVPHSQTFIRKRKMMMVLPIMVIPFLSIAFWALGGGREQITTPGSQTGLNHNLPDAVLEDNKLTDKLAFYEIADKDSIKMEELMRNDPYYKAEEDTTDFTGGELEQLTQNTASKYSQRLNTSLYETSGISPEKKIMEKLAALEKEMVHQPETDPKASPENYATKQDHDLSDDVDRLENMMQVMQQPDDEDPEMQQLNGTLEKILDIQHPDRVREKSKNKSMRHKDIVFSVRRDPLEVNVSLLGKMKMDTDSVSAFYGVGENTGQKDNDNTIEAVVHANQVIVNGAIIKLRLSTDVYINGTLIEKGTCINGITSLNDERLEIEITSIRKGNALFPVSLEVYDIDGLPGIYIPGAITRDVVKQSADNGLQLMDITSIDPSLKAQAASAGINTVKTIISRKVKQVKVLVKAGYKVLLQDRNIRQ